MFLKCQPRWAKEWAAEGGGGLMEEWGWQQALAGSMSRAVHGITSQGRKWLMSLWQFVLPRNRVTPFAGDTLGLGMPLERESQLLPRSVSWANVLASQTLVEAQIIKWTIFDYCMIYYCSFVWGARLWFFRSAVYLLLCLKSLGTIMFIFLKTDFLSFL